MRCITTKWGHWNKLKKNKSINKLIKIKKNYVQYKQVRNSRELYTICTNVSIIL